MFRLVLLTIFVFLFSQPTNHLDIDALDWLAEFLRPGNRENKDLTVLLVTHDRFFLERVCSESEYSKLNHGEFYV